MAFTLKKGIEAFTVVDGPFARRSYRPGTVYNEIPPQEAGKFEQTKTAPPKDAQEPVKTKSRRGTFLSPSSPENEEVQS